MPPLSLDPAPALKAALDTLPDLLRPGLDLVFVGINPGEQSARRGHYYAHPGNAFWRLLSASGLTPREVQPGDDRWLFEACGIGFTDVVKRVVTDSTQVTRAECIEALPAFRARIAAAAPRAVCFTAARPFDEVFPGVRLASGGASDSAGGWGRQPVAFEGIEGCSVWVMPSTSGLAAKWRAEGRQVLAELAASLHVDETGAAQQSRDINSAAQQQRDSNSGAQQSRDSNSGAQRLRDKSTVRA